MIVPVTAETLQEQLRNFDQIATLVHRREDRETWRALIDDKLFYLHFFLRTTTYAQKVGGSLAPLEFSGLKALQSAGIPAIRAVAMLSGFRIQNRLGDAVITHGIPALTRLDRLLLSDEPVDRRALVQQLIALLHAMGKARLGHRDLRLSSFALADGQLMVLDAAQVDARGLKGEHLWNLAFDAEPFASAADRVRVWSALEPDAYVPRVDPFLAARLVERRRALPLRTLQAGEWSLRYLESFDRPLPWSRASALKLGDRDWLDLFPTLLRTIEQDGYTPIKRDASGDVLRARLTLAGTDIAVMIKRPRNKFWYRHLLGFFRASRARRAFDRTLDLLLRHLPVEAPLLVAEKRRGGFVDDCLAIYEEVPGATLDQFDLNSIAPTQRETLFRSLGRILRRIEDTRLAHTDAKSTNWIVFPDPRRGPRAVMVDAYGIRRLTRFLQLSGVQRLLRAMRFHPQYTPADSKHLCLGFSPRANLVRGDPS